MADYDPYHTLLNAAFRFISFRPRSEREVKEFLGKKLMRRRLPTSKDDRTVAQVLARLQELGYVDDEKFVAWWVQQRSLHRPKGVRLLRQELAVKGIDKSLINNVFTNQKCQYSDDRQQNDSFYDERMLAEQALQKKLTRWKKLSHLQQRKNSYDFLGRRGFPFETIKTVIDAVIGKEYNGQEVE